MTMRQQVSAFNFVHFASTTIHYSQELKLRGWVGYFWCSNVCIPLEGTDELKRLQIYYEFREFIFASLLTYSRMWSTEASWF